MWGLQSGQALVLLHLLTGFAIAAVGEPSQVVVNRRLAK